MHIVPSFVSTDGIICFRFICAGYLPDSQIWALNCKDDKNNRCFLRLVSKSPSFKIVLGCHISALTITPKHFNTPVLNDQLDLAKSLRVILHVFWLIALTRVCLLVALFLHNEEDASITCAACTEPKWTVLIPPTTCQPQQTHKIRLFTMNLEDLQMQLFKAFVCKISHKPLRTLCILNHCVP